MQLVKFFVLNIFYIVSCQDNNEDGPTSTRIIHDISTTTIIPHNPENTEKTTTNVVNINFDTPEKVTAEVYESFDDLSRTVNETLSNFNTATRDKFDDECGHLFRDLEREELYNLYQEDCSIDQLTAYEEFQTSLDSVIKLYIDKEHPKIEKTFKEIYKKWIEPFKRDIETNLVTPITSALRFPKSNQEKYISCANQYTPQVLKLIETAFTNVLDCYNMTISYQDTSKFAELIALLYKDTAEKFTTCNQNLTCFKKYCPKTHLLVLKTTDQAVRAMSSIISNFQKEVELIPKCANTKFNNAAYLKTKEELRSSMLRCLK
ncbi:uncharacterized protein [Chironomus tepperi]|uniref:uncharacterized protein n=1 Tax=Chironomus tepperi TaxID=113505 RepID=UPI00391FA6C5